MSIAPRSLRKASKQLISLPDWLPDSINQFAYHPQLGKVKVLGYLATTVRVEKGGKSYQVEAETLTPITQQSTLDLSKISTPLYQELAQLWSEQIHHIETLPETPASYQPIPESLHSSIRNALFKQGIQQLYSHQTRAIAALAQNKSPVITTPTGSGKSLCFSLPAFNEVIKHNKTVLLIYPLKALINDQYQKLTQFNHLLPQPWFYL